MKFKIQQKMLQDEVKKKIFDGFGCQAIESTGINGLDEDPISFEIFKEQEFVGAIIVQLFWGQLHIKYLYVEKPYRGQGIACELMKHACEFGKLRGCHFAFVETMSFQAPEFYQKMGFKIEFSRSGYSKNTTLYYLKKNLNDEADNESVKKTTKVGAYGIMMKGKEILLVRQKKGPYAGKLDFPGGGIEFGESPEQALRREFMEEVAMEFDSLQLIDNLTVVVNASSSLSNESYTFFQIGMIYRISGYRCTNEQALQELEHIWIDPEILFEEQCSSLMWKYRQMHIKE